MSMSEWGLSFSFLPLSFFRFGLRREIPVVARHAVFIRSAMDLNRLVEITVRRRGRRLPFQRRGSPRIVGGHFLALFHAEKKVDDERNLRKAQHPRRPR